MKFPIRWHIECLENMRANVAKKEAWLRREAETLERDRASIVEREAQIRRAQKEKLDSFDSHKFNKKRK